MLKLSLPLYSLQLLLGRLLFYPGRALPISPLLITLVTACLWFVPVPDLDFDPNSEGPALSLLDILGIQTLDLGTLPCELCDTVGSVVTFRSSFLNVLPQRPAPLLSVFEKMFFAWLMQKIITLL